MTQEPTPRLRAVVVDDQALLVSAFTLLLDAQEDIEVVGSAPDGRAALDLLGTLAPDRVDVVLMDLRMPVLDGVAAIAAMRAAPDLRQIPALVLTTFDDEDLVMAALRTGARGFLLKDAAPQVLLEAVRTVAAGGSWLDPAVTPTVLAHLEQPGPDVPTPQPVSSGGRAPQPGAGPHDPAASDTGEGLYEPLTRREAQVLELVCQGLSNARIGEHLHLAESTVKTHVKSLLGKTGTTNRVELIVHAFHHGLERT
ncbi:two-component response regulator [Actinomyces sp. Chiba101]|uniref:DNA-binding response regulator, NarL/FixJ family, contains REC and HTH domains n=1 Tax=Actinomyces denticolens TaxID=52767 RepID=A0ABY1IKK1_9ACTO|nr:MULTISPECIES: response regulator transcription factor [Actinomyces]BAW92763.1 two-component response regulator [Actinomyces sp. Chiba101]GAV94269.1 two-component system response regulator [Actinomyces denticolens]SHJ31119.1 DNA-binding response regulator, NarL/FixJ family, contains REC and HTH domains [Actinomyces denticolens]SUU07203.1 Nitrogen regulation protein C [Actinomyces denticolens]